MHEPRKNADSGRDLFPDRPVHPRIYRVPSGLPFAREFAGGLLARMEGLPPQELARVRIFVSGRGEARFLDQALQHLGSRVLPSVHSLRDLADEQSVARAGRPTVSRWRRRIVLARMVRTYLDRVGDPGVADGGLGLATGLAELLDTLHAEGVDPARLQEAVPGEHADHWEKTARFLAIVGRAWPQMLDEKGLADPEQGRALAVERIIEHWIEAPPRHAVLVAGSTVTDATTARFAAAVAGLPQGAVILPGLDAGLDADAWNAVAGEDRLAPEHPQYTMKRFLERCRVRREDVPAWSDTVPPRPERVRFLGQALRPAPVTNTWRTQAEQYEAIARCATENVELVEAATADEEASVIALVLREAAETPDRRAVFVTEDADLRARVLVKCERWKLFPASTQAGSLAQTPAGRFAILAARAALGQPDLATLLALLKASHVRSGRGNRHWHLRTVSALERIVRSNAGQLPGLGGIRRAVAAWSDRCPDDEVRAERAGKLEQWLAEIEGALEPLARHAGAEGVALGALVRDHHAVMRALAEHEHPDADARSVRDQLGRLARHASEYGSMRAADYPGLMGAALESEGFLVTRSTHPGLMVRGTLEARFDPAELVIFGGLNEDLAPGSRDEDAWLNRAMRQTLGLPPPERAVGTIAHDFAELFAAEHVILTRSRKVGSEEQVASRWLLRLINLLSGTGPNGKAALAGMRERGAARIRLAQRLDHPSGPPQPEQRPCPRPPFSARPRELSATSIERLFRDPYAIYAQKILCLRPLEPLGAPPDARERGTLVHEVLAQWVNETGGSVDGKFLAGRLEALLARAFAPVADWPWRAQPWEAELRMLQGWLVDVELERRRAGQGTCGTEVEGSLTLDLPDGAFCVTARADRVDRMQPAPEPEYFLYDYKTGAAPSANDISVHAVQLRIAGLIALAGGFAGLPAGKVAGADYISLKPANRQGASTGRQGKNTSGLAAEDEEEFRTASRDNWQRTTFARQLAGLLSEYDDPSTGYLSHALPSALSRGGNFDHLARVAEWSAGAPAGDGNDE